MLIQAPNFTIHRCIIYFNKIVTYCTTISCNFDPTYDCLDVLSQCAPGVSNLYQKLHGLFHFCNLPLCEKNQNQSKKNIRQQSSNNFEISIVKTAQKCSQIEDRNIFWYGKSIF